MEKKKMMKYNPAFLTDEELIAGFVVRTKELESILTIIRENTSGSNQHILVEGPRGSGKTMLVRRVAAEIRRDESFNQKWYPILFAEESYMVQTPGEFWLEAIFHLEHQTGDAKWGQIYRELKEEKDEVRLRDGCLAKLIDFANQQKKRLVLVVENMQMILGDQLSDDDAWVLRKTLQHEPKIMLLCTSLADRTVDFEKESKAMYELFKRIELKPLNDMESKALWESVTDKPVTDNRIRPINILTGGNPRLVAIIAEFGANMSFKNLMDNLIQLVDDNTEYFKSHLDSIAAVERKVYLALAEIWDPATAKKVATVARLDVNKTSAILGRLEQEGQVAIDDQKGRKKLYKVAERMYNIYYLMRRRSESSSRVRPFVHFIILFYGTKTEELATVLKSMASEACSLNSQSREDLCFAFGEILNQVDDRDFRNQVLVNVPKPFLNLPETIKAFFDSMKKRKRLPKWEDELIRAFDDLEKAIILNNIILFKEIKRKYIPLFNKIEDHYIKWSTLGMINRYTEDYSEAAICYEKALENKPDDYEVLGNLAACYFKNNDYGKVKTIYETMIKFKEEDLDIWLKYAHLLYNQLREYKSAEEACLRILKDRPKDVEANRLLCLLCFQQNNWKKTKNISSQMIDLYPDNTIFYYLHGAACMHFGEFSEAEKDFETSIKIDSEKGFSYALLSSTKVIEGAYDEAIASMKKMLTDINYVKSDASEGPRLIILLFIKLAAHGYSKELSGMLENSEAREYLQPLAVALKMYQGEKVIVADEILEVAKDVVKKIEEEAKRIGKKSPTGQIINVEGYREP